MDISKLDQEKASMIWSTTVVQIVRLDKRPVAHAKSTFIGYADINLSTYINGKDVGNTMRIRGLQLKVLGGNPYVDMPSEKGKDGKFYPTLFPCSAELRAVLTAKIFEHENVHDAMVEALALTTNQSTNQSASSNNPFSE